MPLLFLEPPANPYIIMHSNNEENASCNGIYLLTFGEQMRYHVGRN